MAASIINHFPFDSFRMGQEEVLSAVESNWDKYDVFVLRCPVAFGKSSIAAAIQSWELSRGNGTSIITPSNLLRNQYLEEFSHMRTVKSQDEYWLPKYNMTEREFRKDIYKWGPKGSEYTSDYQAVRRKSTSVVVNYYSYLAHKLQRQCLIVDEAHNLLGTLQDLSAKTLWQHDYGYPQSATSVGDLLEWLGSSSRSDDKLGRLRTSLHSATPHSLVRMAVESYRGVDKPCLKITPLSVADLPNPFLGKKTDKIVLMSATIGAMDIEKLGLASKRVLYIDVPSSIPTDRRPIIFDPVANMSYSYQEDSIEDLAKKLLTLADSYSGKGFVHATYSMAEKLKPHLAHDDRFIFHSQDKKEKRDKYSDYYALPRQSGKVMIGSGMVEGLDLKGDVAEWQALTKVPYPSLADPSMRHLAENERDYYNWMVSRDVMQASGRICRGPDDRGATHLLDSQFYVWYNKYSSSLPKWFTEAVVGM